MSEETRAHADTESNSIRSDWTSEMSASYAAACWPYASALSRAALRVAELYECAQGSPDPRKAESSLEEFLSGVALAAMTAGLAREVGRAKARLTKSGVRVRCADLITACTASYYGLALLTSRPERYEGLLPQESIVSLQA
ncbi:MAG: hypothetical protein H5T84_01165 [Thermoleophilia bacterium]|nr:hypothetical protein [Thermoleophilia bacterium]